MQLGQDLGTAIDALHAARLHIDAFGIREPGPSFFRSAADSLAEQADLRKSPLLAELAAALRAEADRLENRAHDPAALA